LLFIIMKNKNQSRNYKLSKTCTLKSS